MVNVAAMLMLLAGCGQDQGSVHDKSPRTPDAAAIIAAEELMPADERLAGIYDRSCRTCHAYVDAEAPLTGFAAGWEDRMAKGEKALVATTRQGMGAMPAMGMCLDCSDSDFVALIDFMATAPKGVE